MQTFIKLWFISLMVKTSNTVQIICSRKLGKAISTVGIHQLLRVTEFILYAFYMDDCFKPELLKEPAKQFHKELLVVKAAGGFSL